MKASLEVSMYPLTEDYEQPIINFINHIKSVSGLRVEVNGMSTQVFGEFDLLMDTVKEAMTDVLDEHKAMFVFKLGKGELFKEKLPEGL